MEHTFYDGTIVVLQGILESLAHILRQAEAFSASASFLESRLHADMYPLADQVRIAVQFSERLVARMTSREQCVFEGNPTTLALCHERIQTVLRSLKEADKDTVNQRKDVLEATEMGPGKTVQLSNAVYAHTVVIPNVYFHFVTAYGILRKEGVPLSKIDYYTGFFPSLVTGA